MHILIATIALVLCLPLSAWAQQGAALQPQQAQDQPEEIVISGKRPMLRTQMMAAEKTAYDIFNKFNDEKRFDVSCSMQQPTGTHLEGQVCLPNFVLDADAVHARAYWEQLRAEYDQAGLDYRPAYTDQPREAVISAQQAEYQRTMRQVAAEHPEFLEALIRYTEMREQYEGTTAVKVKD
jgi:hypothetical protein